MQNPERVTILLYAYIAYVFVMERPRSLGGADRTFM